MSTEDVEVTPESSVRKRRPTDTASGSSSEPEREQTVATGVLDVVKALKPLLVVIAVALTMLILGYALVPPDLSTIVLSSTATMKKDGADNSPLAFATDDFLQSTDDSSQATLEDKDELGSDLEDSDVEEDLPKPPPQPTLENKDELNLDPDEDEEEELDDCSPIFNLELLISALNKFTQWQRLGEVLHADKDIMKALSSNKQSEVESAKLAMLHAWYKSQTDPCWDTIVEALVLIGDLQLAKKIAIDNYLLWLEDSNVS